MKYSLAFLSGLSGLLLCNILLTTAAYADVYAYHGANGERILTDKRIYNKHYRLIKTYKTRSKRPSSTTNSSKQTKISSKKRRSTAFHCSNKAFLKQKQRAYQKIIRSYAKRYNVEEALIHSVVKQESCFNEKALSRAGAIGLMQLMPGTADYLKVKDPWNPEQNIHGGVKYLSKMLKRFKGNTKYALAAYNAGPNKVIRYGGIPPYRETQHYVRKIMANYKRLKRQGL